MNVQEWVKENEQAIRDSLDRKRNGWQIVALDHFPISADLDQSEIAKELDKLQGILIDKQLWRTDNGSRPRYILQKGWK